MCFSIPLILCDNVDDNDVAGDSYNKAVIMRPKGKKNEPLCPLFPPFSVHCVDVPSPSSTHLAGTEHHTQLIVYIIARRASEQSVISWLCHAQHKHQANMDLTVMKHILIISP